eukprot:CAMPEP_0170581532 /NCGR_PEP_ID=MMETSP0224-20130122/7091_1 /TAXON_ID=285029 /ORGANISM="Togula jolla, Strain CCCM 725" /LENGTH=324 /DNA_ID=CAMNT_0010904677 /DNA_START=60 /DNA_END=1031 /DNA_ORIENTATION=+
MAGLPAVLEVRELLFHVLRFTGVAAVPHVKAICCMDSIDTLNSNFSMVFPPLLYVIGGQDNHACTLSSVELFRPDASGCGGQWNSAPPLPFARAGVAAAVFEANIYVIGGFGDDAEVRDTVSVMALGGTRWTGGPPLRDPRACVAVVAASTGLYAIGGDSQEFAAVGSVERLASAASESWEPLPSLRHARGGAAAVSLCGDIHVLGGINSAQAFSSMEAYSPGSSAWRQLPNMSVARGAPTSVVLRGRILAIGGCDGQSLPLATVEWFDRSIGAWEDLVPLAIPRMSACATAICGAVFVIGGRTSSGDITEVTERLEPGLNASW